MPTPAAILAKFLADSFKSKIFDEAYNAVKNQIKSTKSPMTFTVVKGDLQQSLTSHIKIIANQIDFVKIREMEKAKSINEIYISLDLRLSAKKWDDFNKKPTKTFSLQNLITTDKNHLIVLGDPGAGKSTSLKKLCSLIIFPEDESSNDFNFPILIRLRELNEKERIFDRLSRILSYRISFAKSILDDSQKQEFTENFLQSHLTKYLDDLGVLIMLDGLDEVPEKKASGILSDVEVLTSSLTKSKVIITCRAGSYERQLSCATIYQIEPLNKPQIEHFVGKWFSEIKKRKKFTKELYNSPYFENSIKPLDLAQLCAIFEKYERIPDQPKDVYRKRVRLYLEDWDAQNDVKRDTKYSQLDVDAKFEFFTHLAYELSISFPKKVYNEIELQQVYKSICNYFDLPKNEYRSVIKELETHTGLIVASSNNQFEFYHKTTQEYFTAFYLHQLPEIPVALIEKFPNEFAIATALCPDPDLYFMKLLLKFTSQSSSSSTFLLIYLNRVLIEKVRFRKNPLIVAPLLLAYEKCYITVQNQTNKYLSIEKMNEIDGKSTDIYDVMVAFLKENFSKTTKKSFLLYYTLTSTNSNHFHILVPKMNNDFYKGYGSEVVNRRIMLYDKYLSFFL